MGYSYVYPPLSKSATSKIDEVEPLPTSPPALPPKIPEETSFLPSLNPQKEFQSFLDNIGNKFNFNNRQRQQPSNPEIQISRNPEVQISRNPEIQISRNPDMHSRPSNNVQLVRRRQQIPRNRRPNNAPRRRIDPGTQRKFIKEYVQLVPDIPNPAN